MSVMRTGVGLLAVAAVAGVLAGCGSDSGEVAALTTQVEQLTEERDALQERVDAAPTRHDKTMAAVEGVRAILDDPASVGDEAAVAAALAAFATPDAQMEDDAYHEAVPMERAWAQTLSSNGIDAQMDVLHQWVSDDGSMSGGMWIWHGTNLVGNPFELIGVQVDTHDDEGRISHELVLYPYPDEYVVQAIEGDGTPLVLTAQE
jgi:outer membrane murein-binding lipoprotein Lpp